MKKIVRKEKMFACILKNFSEKDVSIRKLSKKIFSKDTTLISGSCFSDKASPTINNLRFLRTLFLF